MQQIFYMSNCLYQQNYVFVGFKTLGELKNFSIKNKHIYNLLFIPNKITTLCFLCFQFSQAFLHPVQVHNAPMSQRNSFYTIIVLYIINTFKLMLLEYQQTSLFIIVGQLLLFKREWANMMLQIQNRNRKLLQFSFNIYCLT